MVAKIGGFCLDNSFEDPYVRWHFLVSCIEMKTTVSQCGGVGQLIGLLVELP